MFEGNDDIDLMDDEYGFDNENDTLTQDNLESPDSQEGGNLDSIDQYSNEPIDNDSLVLEMLKSKGIEDPSRIKFDRGNGEIEEVSWNHLSADDKLNILDTSINTDNGLEADEVQLINAIRSSQLTPAEYLQFLQRSSVESYLDNVQSQYRNYSIDQYTDDELYVMDLINKTQDITEEEALEALEKAKSNEVLFQKQVNAMRNEYRASEEETIQYNKLAQQQQAQYQFNQYAEQIEDAIINFKEFSGCQLNMSNDDMQDLYTFITGYDNAGNSWFGKALRDPQTVVQMAWFALNGEQMVQDMNNYYQREITNVRKESYNRGLSDARKKDNPTITYKPKGKPKFDQTYDDLDDF